MRNYERIALWVSFGSLAFAGAGCLPSISDLDHGPLTQTFAVSDYFTPSGYMGDGQHFGLMTGEVNTSACKPRPPGARGNCYAFTWYPNSINEDPWAGVYWVFPANSWGSTYGHAIDGSKFKQVSFYAAIDPSTPYSVGEQPDQQPVVFKGIAGGIDPHGTFGDTLPGARDYADAISATATFEIGTEVTSELKRFHIALTDLNKMSNCAFPIEGQPVPPENCMPSVDAMGQPIKVANDLIGGFAWATHYPTGQVACKDGTTACQSTAGMHSAEFLNPKPVTVYLDDIVWETE